MAYYVSQLLCLYSLNSGDFILEKKASHLSLPTTAHFSVNLTEESKAITNPKPSPSPLLKQASLMALSYTPTSLGFTSTQRLCKERTFLVVRSVSKAGLGIGFRSGLVPLAQYSFRNRAILPCAASHEESVSDIE